jgi:hypothetical protein
MENDKPESLTRERRLRDLAYLREMLEEEERVKSQVIPVQPPKDAPDVLS